MLSAYQTALVAECEVGTQLTVITGNSLPAFTAGEHNMVVKTFKFYIGMRQGRPALCASGSPPRYLAQPS